MKKIPRKRKSDDLIRDNKNVNENVSKRRESRLDERTYEYKLESKGRGPRPRGSINFVSVKAITFERANIFNGGAIKIINQKPRMKIRTGEMEEDAGEKRQRE